MAEQSTTKRPVLVTTEFRGVFFGWLDDPDPGETVKLTDARNVIYWSEDVRGFLGLASNGPTDGCKIGPRADIELRKVTSIADVSEDALNRWESLS